MTRIERAIEAQQAREKEQRERDKATHRRMKAEMQHRDEIEYGEPEE
jgi:hypothetical protein